MQTFGILIVLIFGVSIYYFFKDRDAHLKSSVDSQGGFKKKYAYLISRLLKEPNSRIIKSERDSVIIEQKTGLGDGIYIITEFMGDLEIIWKADLGRFGKEYKKWNYNSSVDQVKIIRDIHEYKISLM